MLAILETLLNYLSVVGGLIPIIAVIAGATTSFIFFRSKWRAHKFSKVFFPRSREEFYDYYTKVISKAKKSVYITSDGFNMRNQDSRKAAEIMNDAQAKAIENGASVLRYQITKTMHLNWLPVICQMHKQHKEKYKTYINKRFEDVGSFCVIDPGTRKTIFEFMLPEFGGFGQSTRARYFGFVHGHQYKSDSAKEAFETIFADEGTIEVSEDNVLDVMKDIWDWRVKQYFENKDYNVFDEEIIQAIRECDGKPPEFDAKYFSGLA